MKVAIIGYGQMGKAIEHILLNRGHEVIARFGSSGIDKDILATADVAIEFSKPETAFQNLLSCFDLKVPVVSGTTGWLDRYDEAVEICNEKKGALLYASNFSLGVNIFFEINKYLARIMDAHEQYDISMKEIHHTRKLDAPSGTAISLAQDVINQVKRKKEWALDVSKQASSLHIEAVRDGNVPGTHVLTYDSEIDTIEITHTAKGRTGFALGAVLAAEFLTNKQGVYHMKDVLNF